MKNSIQWSPFSSSPLCEQCILLLFSYCELMLSAYDRQKVFLLSGYGMA